MWEVHWVLWATYSLLAKVLRALMVIDSFKYEILWLSILFSDVVFLWYIL